MKIAGVKMQGPILLASTKTRCEIASLSHRRSFPCVPIFSLNPVTLNPVTLVKSGDIILLLKEALRLWSVWTVWSAAFSVPRKAAVPASCPNSHATSEFPSSHNTASCLHIHNQYCVPGFCRCPRICDLSVDSVVWILLSGFCPRIMNPRRILQNLRREAGLETPARPHRLGLSLRSEV